MNRSGATSNADEIERLLAEMAGAFDMTRPGEEGSLGEDLLDIYALGVYERTVGSGLDVEGKPLAANRGRYGARKEERGLPVGIGLDATSTTTMLSLVQLKGTRDIKADLATSVYSTDQFAFDKANWFTYGSDGSSVYWEYSGARGQPQRPFWGFDDDIERQLVTRCDTHLERFLRRLGG